MSRRTRGLGFRPRAASRSGFALLLCISVMALLITYLVAAQGSVMWSARQMKFTSDRLDLAGAVGDLLSQAGQSLKAGALTNESEPVEISVGILFLSQTFLRLEDGSSRYASLPGISHRDGDALVTILRRGGGVQETLEFVINTAGMRRGAIRIQ